VDIVINSHNILFSEREREFIQDWVRYDDGGIMLIDFVEKWKSNSKDWKLYSGFSGTE